MISQRTVREVLERATTLDVVRDFVELQKRGGSWWAPCPFHNERSASFHVDERRNIYKCFGCGKGGGAVDFLMEHQNMAFPEAIKHLASKYGIMVEEETRELSEKEKTQAILRENGLTVLAQVQAFFEAQFVADTPSAKRAKAYASNRWGFDFCRDNGIGYAPFPKDFFGWVKAHSVAFDTLLELGIVRKKEDADGYSFMFCNRVTIPIRDRYGRVIAFTARSLEDKPQCKYLNSTTSSVYRKGDTIFGIDLARRAAPKARRLYIVEGAPDVLGVQRLGIDNVVAALGTEWTEGQFNAVKGVCDTLCFIPDSEVPKEGEAFGPGFTAVLRNGKAAVQLGFKVMVKEIPLDDCPKQDADSYFTSREIFDATAEVDFPEWYADKMFLTAKTQMGRTEVVKDVCALLASLDDETLAVSYLDVLAKKHKENSASKPAWNAAFRQAKNRRRKDDSDASASEEPRELYGRYGFFIANNCYCDYSDKGEVNQLSNFTLTPLYSIPDGGSRTRLYKIVNDLGEESILPLDPSEHVKLDKFRERLNIAGNYVWMAKIDQLQRVERYLFKHSRQANMVSTLGWQSEGFFAYGDGVFTDRFIPVDEIGMVHLKDLGTFYLPAFSQMYRDNRLRYLFEKSFTYSHKADVSLSDYLRLFVDVFGDNGRMAIAFIFATLFRDHLFDKFGWFPMFNIFGKPQSGKSTLGKAMKGFFTTSFKPISFESETYAAVNRTIERTANCVVHFDEYKNSLDQNKIDLLKNLWDGTGRGKMKDGEVERINIVCGVIISGQEMPTIDPALFTRIVMVSVNKTSYTLEERRRYSELMDYNRQGVCHLTMQVVKHRERFLSDFEHFCELTRSEVVNLIVRSGKNISDRMYMNWVVLLASYRTMERILRGEGERMPFTYDELLPTAMQMMTEQYELFSRGDEVGSFWEIVSILNQESKIFEQGDFRIDHDITRLKPYDGPERQFSEPKRVLILRDRRIIQLYIQMKGRDTRQLTLGADMMASYLTRSDAFLCKVRRKFYKMTPFGVPIKDNSGAGGQGRQLYDTDTALAFDYDMVCKQYNISLKSDADALTADEHAEEQRNNPQSTQSETLPF